LLTPVALGLSDKEKIRKTLETYDSTSNWKSDRLLADALPRLAAAPVERADSRRPMF